METRLRAPALPATWRVIRSPDADGVTNMAIDAALLSDTARRTGGTLRVYGWTSPTVSFGRNESTRGRFDERSLAAAGLEGVRRPTGGRALLHAREVTYSVTFPLGSGLGWQAAYAWVNTRLLHALRALGVDATLAPAMGGGGAIRPDGPLCFAHPAPGEIVVGGAKLVGSAVWREGRGYLQHGSILLHDDQSRLAQAARVSIPFPPSAAALSALLPPARRTWAAVSDALIDAFLGVDPEDGVAGSVRASLPRNEFCAECVTGVTDDPSLLADIERFADEFRSPAWLWRR